MNVAIAVHNFDHAEGTGGYAVELATRFAEEHEVTIYARHVNAPVPPGARVVRVPARSGSAYATILTFPRALKRVMESHDLVHAQGWVAGAADVVTAHIVMQAWREAARRGAITPPWGERVFGGWVQDQERKLIAERARAVIAPSEQARDDIARCYGRDRDVFVVRHAFPTPRNLPPRDVAFTQLRIPDEAFCALYVGDARKGLHRAMHAVARTSNHRLLIVSHSPPAAYLSEARRLGLANRMHWLGPLRDLDIVYAAADVLLHPTVYDTFGLVVAEAMAFGTPVIVSRNAGIAELIEDGRSGVLVESNSPEEISGHLDQMAHDAQRLAAMAAAAQEVAGKRGWDVVARETLAVYQLARQ
jgi:UDP-glucose:(heptosyl)LPS alpha-1,3-glucosyltransferase